jgi:hypothetical protein
MPTFVIREVSYFPAKPLPKLLPRRLQKTRFRRSDSATYLAQDEWHCLWMPSHLPRRDPTRSQLERGVLYPADVYVTAYTSRMAGTLSCWLVNVQVLVIQGSYGEGYPGLHTIRLATFFSRWRAFAYAARFGKFLEGLVNVGGDQAVRDYFADPEEFAAL